MSMNRTQRRVLSGFFFLLAVGVGLKFYYASPAVLDDPRKAMDSALSDMKKRVTLDERSARYFQIEYAIRHYQVTHQGVLPKSLGDLVPKYFDAIPQDPTTGKQFEPPRAMNNDAFDPSASNKPPVPQSASNTRPGMPLDNSIDLSPGCPAGLERHPTMGVCVTKKSSTPTPVSTPTPEPTVFRERSRH